MPPTKIEVPEDRENESDEWKKEYQRAIDKGNSPKAACIHADHAREVEERKGGQAS